MEVTIAGKGPYVYMGLKIPQGSVGPDYIAIKVTIGGKGPYEFMVDSGLTFQIISPHLAKELGTLPSMGQVDGYGAGGSTPNLNVVKLSIAALCCGEFPASPTYIMLALHIYIPPPIQAKLSNVVKLSNVALCCGEFPASPPSTMLALPPLSAAVLNFLQEHLDPSHDPVEGMIGMEVIKLFDTDLDFPNNRVQLQPTVPKLFDTDLDFTTNKSVQLQPTVPKLFDTDLDFTTNKSVQLQPTVPKLFDTDLDFTTNKSVQLQPTVPKLFDTDLDFTTNKSVQLQPTVLKLFDTDLDFPNKRIGLWPPGTSSKLAALQGPVQLPAALFDTDLDFPIKRIRLWPPGTASKLAASEGLVQLPAAVLNETGTTPAAPVQPFVGILDIGATVSAITPQAAQLLGMQFGADGSLAGSDSSIVILGMDGNPQKLPTKMLGFSFFGRFLFLSRSAGHVPMQCEEDRSSVIVSMDGNPRKLPTKMLGFSFFDGFLAGSDSSIVILGMDDNPQKLPNKMLGSLSLMLGLSFFGGVVKGKDGRLRFNPPPADWTPWDPVLATVGELPGFSSILGDGLTPYRGPAALIGLDVLSQRRVGLGAAPKDSTDRRRDVFVSRA
eukprot:gene26402-17499_t